MPNELVRESSPYLRQHASNPVEWLAWGERALARARATDRPLIVSIGYSSCHWCHVMERECFEDEAIAQLMNECFVCVKVDREERPDVDALYMEAVQAMTGHGGWPLNVFITPEQIPFYGGTYFPPHERDGMPGFPQVLQAVAEAWDQRKLELRAGGERLIAALGGAVSLKPPKAPFTPGALDGAVVTLGERFDARHGGFGGAPKFPQTPVIEWLLHRAARNPSRSEEELEMAVGTLGGMVNGGIHDVVGGGFHRYSVDDEWAVPHFEKMLYDNALLARACLHAFQLSGDRVLLDACLGTLAWAMREMRGPEGGFFSALDADSEGVEGGYYMWTADELRSLLGSDADAAIAWLGATEHGLNVLRQSGPGPDRATRTRILQALRLARQDRIMPGLDDKRLTAWNALMISALADAGAVLARDPELQLEDGTAAAPLGGELIDVARACADFVWQELRDERGRLLRTYSAGVAKLPAYLEDHALLMEAMLDLYQATFEERFFTQARVLADEIVAHFADGERGGFFSTADDHERLLVRRKELEDNPLPAGSSSAARGMLRLAALSGESSYAEQASSALRLVHEIATRHPGAFGHLLQALQLRVDGIVELALAGHPGAELDALLAVLAHRPHPGLVLACGPGDGARSAVALLEGRAPVNGRAAAYVCEHFSCKRPVSEPAELRAALE